MGTVRVFPSLLLQCNRLEGAAIHARIDEKQLQGALNG
jgi:hypothetical protein